MSSLPDTLPSGVKIVSGVGDPASPLWGKLLTQEEEQRHDEAGNPIVSKEPWSKVPTGIYLCVAVSGRIPKASIKIIGGQTTSVPSEMVGAPRYITIGTFVGRPTFNVPTTGAVLEVPADLADDELKRQYVVEWLVHTAREALTLSGVDLGADEAKTKELGLWLAMAAQAGMERAM